MRGYVRWSPVVIFCAIGALIAFFAMGWDGWVQAWIGQVFRAASGGALGWAISRYVVSLDISNVAPADRPIAGLSQAILVAGMAVAVA